MIELFEDRQTIKSTERDSLTRLYTREYFYKYVADEEPLVLDPSTLLKSVLALLIAIAF